MAREAILAFLMASGAQWPHHAIQSPVELCCEAELVSVKFVCGLRTSGMVLANIALTTHQKDDEWRVVCMICRVICKAVECEQAVAEGL